MLENVYFVDEPQQCYLIFVEDAGVQFQIQVGKVK
jgi:hypothetical protein